MRLLYIEESTDCLIDAYMRHQKKNRVNTNKIWGFSNDQMFLLRCYVNTGMCVTGHSRQDEKQIK
jgi:hypothetical protein